MENQEIKQPKVLEPYKQIERSIITKYRKKIWSKFVNGVKEYELIQEGDRIAICISGGKDSMLLAKCMQELLRHGKFHFELVFLVMDPGYNAINIDLVRSNAELLNIPIEVFQSPIFEVVDNVDGTPCYLCARMRRGYLYKEAKARGCNKIALGHHFDDVIETTMLSMLYSGEIKTMMPKLHSQNYEGMELIRPLYNVREEHIIAWRNSNNLKFVHCGCPLTENKTAKSYVSPSKRKEVKGLIRSFREINPHIEMNLFRSTQNINLNTVLGYRKDGDYHSFLDTYYEDISQED